MTTEKGMKMAEELASAKASVRLVSIPEGTSVPGCEENDPCYDPPHVIIFEDAEVTWKNNDTGTQLQAGLQQAGLMGNLTVV